MLSDSDHALRLLSISPQLLLSYLLHRKNEEKCLSMWHSLLSSIASSQTPDLAAIRNLLEATQRGKLPRYLKPQQAELEGFISGLLEKALSGSTNSNEAQILKQISVSAGWLLFLIVFVTISHEFLSRLLLDTFRF